MTPRGATPVGVKGIVSKEHKRQLRDVKEASSIFFCSEKGDESSVVSQPPFVCN
jgi:hypothetical protein